ncbi:MULTISPECIES: TetR/AcrR family transcriptional regulator [Chryseobacterium]|jgi:AcrR family transcriptional regulator|uniref:AcrR family transcriptional regulator n=1 Tax=Chryseobacterium rhizosphaerae TaxID=395937 RepID=A0AAE4BZT9_9FLAO|nr:MULTISPECIES: TetR/AcrR family transcriptional regulator [Chryseobacterium]MBL3549931.1 TetR/AcrR family transcriptional regulator [Chryseobacterium sp. KMC2]MDC8100057.1 TetR/AcrR family transcriptional regulator [Chryseobacterium rhizosphaerae]MDR6524881.1 AcrR family transcriptional regulator [Chryseobacterium rhizosphaerae]MDR6548069.1 AcrR family transcriptional regulator [Chryseobacterium rhizosphaerae]REC73559.1 TetR/AcrR family transcriptional regulator [Chryseobacterium rhizosphaer
MPRKVVQGPIRDKEKTKQKLLAAVGKILRVKGYSGLKVSKIAAVAGFDKKLIYEYFGSTDKLIDEYIKSQDYWSKFSPNIEEEVQIGKGKEALTQGILTQFESLKKNKELQKIILWELSESKPILKNILKQREEVGANLFENVTDPYFGENATSIRAMLALVVAGVYYLNLFPAYNGTEFCGIDMRTEEGRGEVEKVIVEIIDHFYQTKK